MSGDDNTRELPGRPGLPEPGFPLGRVLMLGAPMVAMAVGALWLAGWLFVHLT